MSKTLFEQYQEAKAEFEENRPGDQEGQQLRDQFEELSAIIEAEGLELIRFHGQYVVCTVDGEAVTDYLANLDEVESWLDDPGFIFQEQKKDADPPFDLDDVPDGDTGVTVAQMNRFEDKFSQTAEDARELILRRLFDIDQQDRKHDFDNANLRWKSVEDLYWLLNNGHQEQIRRYMILLLADQKCGG